MASPAIKTKGKTKRRSGEIDLVIGANLKAFRTAKNLSQSELAKAIGVTFQQVQKYENGVNRISASTLYRIARFLEVSVIDFYEGLPEKNRN